MRHAPRPKRRKPKVLATDLDGTLIPLAGNQRNRTDLESLRVHLAAGGIALTFVTGRHLAIVEEAIVQHRLPQPDWIICDVGTSIYRRTAGGWQAVSTYSEQMASLCTSLPMPRLRGQLPVFEGLALQEEEKQGPYKLSFYVDRRRLDACVGGISDWLRRRDAPYSLISSADPLTGAGLIDLLPQGVSKAFAVDWWRSHCGFDQREIVFAGDSGNDWAALTAGYRSIVVANAERQLAQAVARHHAEQGWTDLLHLAVTPATSGVLEGCRTFGLFDPTASS
ncbi:MAG: HAD family hydrolase [Planctomycetaceae bacterium]